MFLFPQGQKKAALGGLSVALSVHLRLGGNAGMLHAARCDTYFESERSDPFGQILLYSSGHLKQISLVSFSATRASKIVCFPVNAILGPVFNAVDFFIWAYNVHAVLLSACRMRGPHMDQAMTFRPGILSRSQDLMDLMASARHAPPSASVRQNFMMP